MDWGHLFFTFSGRINRTKFLIAMLACTVVYLIIYCAVALTESSALDAVGGMINIVILIALLAVGAKRLHDRNKSAWYLVLFYIVPAVLVAIAIVMGTFMEDSIEIAYVFGLVAVGFMIWAFVEMGCLRGTVGANLYGPDSVASASLPQVHPTA